jgi:hypothetical protein
MTFYFLSQTHVIATEDNKGVEIMSNPAIIEAYRTQRLAHYLITL